MSLTSGMMAQGTSLLMSIFGETGILTYQSPGGKPFTCDAIIGSERGGINQSQQTGNIEKVSRLPVKIETAVLIENGVTGLQGYAAITYADISWNIDLSQSVWGESMVKLMLMVTETARFAGPHAPIR